MHDLDHLYFRPEGKKLELVALIVQMYNHVLVEFSLSMSSLSPKFEQTDYPFLLCLNNRNIFVLFFCGDTKIKNGPGTATYKKRKNQEQKSENRNCEIDFYCLQMKRLLH